MFEISDRNLGESFRRTAADKPHSIAWNEPILVDADISVGKDSWSPTVREYRNHHFIITNTTYSDLEREVDKFATFLQESGMTNDSHIGVLSTNRHEWMEAILGSYIAGGVITGLPLSAQSDRLAGILDRIDIEFLVVENQEKLDLVLKGFGLDNPSALEAFNEEEFPLKKIVVFDPFTVDPRLNRIVVGFTDAKERYPQVIKESDFNYHNTEGDDLASILLTSATTGQSKGVMHAQRSYLIQNLQLEYSKVINPETTERVFQLLPLGHIYAFGLFNLLVAKGRTAGFPPVVDRTSSEMTPARMRLVLQSLAKFKPHAAPIVPAVPEKLLDKLEKNFLGAIALQDPHASKEIVAEEYKRQPGAFNKIRWGALRGIGHLLQGVGMLDRYRSFVREGLVGDALQAFISGGGPLDPWVFQMIDQRLGIPLAQGYGSNEAMIVLCNRLDGREGDTVGTPIHPSIQTRLGEDGELHIKSPVLMKGYYKNKEATEKALPPDGWYRSSDKATIDERNVHRIFERTDDVLALTNGQKVDRRSLARKIVRGTSGIKQLVVVGHQKRELKALVEPLDPESATKEGLLEEIKWFQNESDSPRYERIADIRFVKDIPISDKLDVRIDEVVKKNSALIDEMYSL